MATDRIMAAPQTVKTTAKVAPMLSCAVVPTDGFTDCDDSPNVEVVTELGLTKFDEVVVTGTTAMLLNYLHMACKRTNQIQRMFMFKIHITKEKCNSPCIHQSPGEQWSQAVQLQQQLVQELIHLLCRIKWGSPQ